MFFQPTKCPKCCTKVYLKGPDYITFWNLGNLGSWTLGSAILTSSDQAYKEPEHHKLLCQSPQEPLLVADIASAYGQKKKKKKIRTSLQQGEWVTSIVFKDAYFHIPGQEQSRKYLRFHVQDRTYRFKALPFGLSTAPLESL